VRSYGQYCAVAKALDVIGDRWTLLIVRELFLRGPSRYTDLRAGLPGIATNLLADRLRELEHTGVVSREEAPPPIATALFALTARGRELKPVIDALGNWGLPLMAGETSADDAFRSLWLTWPIERLLTDRTPEGPVVTIQLNTGDHPMYIETVDGGARSHPGTAERPDAVLTGAPALVLGLLTGQLELDEARARGLQYEGEVEVVRRVQPVSLVPDTMVPS